MAGGCGQVTFARYYRYQIAWSHEGEEHVAHCLEFSSLSFLADTPVEALEGLIATVG